MKQFKMDLLRERPDIIEKIRQVCVDEGLPNFEFKNVATNPKGEGFLGQIFFVTCVDGAKTLDLVVKVAFTDKKVREIAPIGESFENEILFYSEILPEFRKFAKNKGVELGKIPKCYYCSDEEEILIFENLKMKGFDTFDKRKVWDRNHVELIFKNYGVYHGVSMAFKEQKPVEYENFSKRLLNVFETLLDAKNFPRDLGDILKDINGFLEKGSDDKIIEYFKKYVDDGVGVYRDVVTASSKNAILLHGDCWSNNMMFKYEDGGSIPTDIRLFDFQLMKSGSPTCDLSYFFYSGASKELYDKLDDLLEIYYKSLGDTLKLFGIDVETLYPITELKNDWRKFGKFGFLMSTFIIKLKTISQENIKDVTDQAKLDDDAKIEVEYDEELYKRRMLDLVYHMYDYGVL